jgi:hypothetical protein
MRTKATLKMMLLHSALVTIVPGAPPAVAAGDYINCGPATRASPNGLPP